MPNSRWIAGFVGDVNLIEGRVVSRDGAMIDVMTNGAGSLRVACADGRAGDNICLAIRPEKIRVMSADSKSSDDRNRRACIVTNIGYLGGVTLYTLTLDGGVTLRATLANTARRDGDAFAVGDHVCATFAPGDAVVLTR